MKRDIKNAAIDKLVMIRNLMESGNLSEAEYQLADIIDSLNSSMVSIVYKRPESSGRPGDCESGDMLAAMNID